MMDARELVTEAVRAQLDAGASRQATSAPRSIHGHAYGGVGAFLLASRPFGSPWWLTDQEARRRGGRLLGGRQRKTLATFRTRLGSLGCYWLWNVEQFTGLVLPPGVASAMLAPLTEAGFRELETAARAWLHPDGDVIDKFIAGMQLPTDTVKGRGHHGTSQS